MSGDGVRVSAVVPAYNEAGTIEAVVGALLGIGIEVVVADDGSTDDTGDRARRAGASVVTTGRRLGKGGALAAGMVAVSPEFDIVVFVDADVGDTAEEVGHLVDAVRANRADIAIGVPPPGQSGGFGAVQFLARRWLTAMTGREYVSPLSGQRAISRCALDRLLPFADGFGVEVLMSVRAARAGLRISEIPVSMTHRRTGRSITGWLHRGRQLWHIARALSRERAGWRKP